MVTAIDCAYAAGLFDGEGCVLLMAGPRIAPHRVRLKVEIVQVEPAALYWLQLHFGGNVVLRRQRPTQHSRMPYRWDLCGRSALQFLQCIRPYLLIKAPQADVAVQFMETVQVHGGVRRPLSESVIQARERFRGEMRRLNKRGIA